MKISFKLLDGSVFDLDLEPAMPISEVKVVIFQTRGFAVELQKLIYSGKVMEDAKPLSEYNITDKGFIVIMLVGIHCLHCALYLIFVDTFKASFNLKARP